MGVPAFHRWLSSRYPKCVVLLDEEEAKVVDGVEIPVDCTQETPNGHVDNLYLDMNGIIHPCFHPEDKACFKDIFAYIDRIMRIVRPRKLVYMAIDGVAPRAKMNQQRARRFKSAKDAKDKVAEENRIRAELRSEGVKVRESANVTETTALSDSNIITPGTEFMAKLSVALQYYIHQRLHSQPAWKSLVVMLSDANVPGEGEHKIMEYIREQRGRPGWHPNLVHVVSGLDADLIHLALATHEPHFHILREVVFGAHAGDAADSEAAPKVPYQYLKISILRDYIALEFNDIHTQFPFDKERIFDDFVFLCFFVGNDFLPHSPTLEIREGGIDLLMSIYRQKLPFLHGYLCEGARVNLKRVEIIVREVARCEEQILQKRMRILKNQDNKRKSNVKRPMSTSLTPPRLQVPVRSTPVNCKSTPKKQKTVDGDTTPRTSSDFDRMDEGSTPVEKPKLWEDMSSVTPVPRAALNVFDTSRSETNLDEEKTDAPAQSRPQSSVDAHMADSASLDGQKTGEDLMSISPKAKPSTTFLEPSRSENPSEEGNSEIEEMVKTRLKNSTHEKADMFDTMVQLGEAVAFGTKGWKDRYYRMKFPNVPQKERAHLVAGMVEKYVEGLVWVMAYYYEGVASWTWYYPYHYAPFASDMSHISHIKPAFELGDPFLPVNQLMAVLPAASRFALPECLQHLFVDKDSPILDFYPENFECDMNGKRFAWQAVVLLPFIDAKRLIDTTKRYFGQFTDEEKERNKRKLTQLYVGRMHPLSQFIQDSVSQRTTAPIAKLELDAGKCGGMNGYLCLSEAYFPDTISAPYRLGEDLERNTVCMASFLNPIHQVHRCKLMSNAREEVTGVTAFDIPPEQELWHEHPRASHSLTPRPTGPRPQFSIDKGAARRFIEHGVAHPRYRDDAPRPSAVRGPRPSPIKSTLRASAPEFVPDHVTRMALQMTGHYGQLPPAIQPPLVPPEAVTEAAVRLSERVRRPQMGYVQSLPQIPTQLFPTPLGPTGSLQGGFQYLTPPPAPVQMQRQPQIRGPAFFAPYQVQPGYRPDFRHDPRHQGRSSESKAQRKRKM